MSKQAKHSVIFSGGGTGGHIYPAVAVATALKKRLPETEILFVGAEGRMEMEKVPKAGFEIIGLPVAGIQRRLTLKNLAFPFKLLKSLSIAKSIVKKKKPSLAIGFGGYASGPILKQAQKKGVPTILQEQNSFAGLTNKWLAKKSKAICVAYEGMSEYFPAESIVFTGNPVRQDILELDSKKESAYAHFDLDPNRKTVLVIGGSLGAKTLNDSLLEGLDEFVKANVQVLWQSGKYYYKDLKSQLGDEYSGLIKLKEFIYEMDQAYAVADVVISRAGALSISELCVAGKASVLVPSPNVAEDHQTKNAMALVKKDAAILVKDDDARGSLVKETLALINDEQRIKELEINSLAMGKPHAAETIVDEILKYLSN